MTVVVVSVAGSLGALGRYLVSGAVQKWTRSPLPLGTATVNLLGAFLLGLIVGAGDGSLLWTVAAGVMGGFTTFSTWMVETGRLGVVPRPTGRALGNLLVLATAGVALAALGYHLTN